MRQSAFSGAQITATVRSTEAGEAVRYAARRYGGSEAKVYNWKKR